MRVVLTTLLMLMSFTASQAQEIEMADTMRSEGKIYVVVAVVAIVFAVLSVFMISLDRKVSRLEKSQKD
jgi:hypothetical protein